MMNTEAKQRLRFIEEELSKLPAKVQNETIDADVGQQYAEALFFEAMQLLAPEIATHYAAVSTPDLDES